jgi:O-antigen ligase
VAAAPIAVCLLDPTGWFGADQAATYAYSAVLFVTVRAYATSAGRRQLVVAVVLGAAVAQFAWAMITWVGGADPGAMMNGTFYWYNQFAAFLLAPAVIGAGLAAIGHGQLRLAGALTAVIASAGVMLSTSRASIALLLAGWLAAGLLSVLVGRDLRARVLAGCRWLAVAAAAAVVTTTLPGPPFFDHRVSALAATSARNAQESVSQNGGYRLDFWKQALVIFRHHPVTGAGFSSFGSQSGRLDPLGVHSTLVHSGLLQPLSDGGLLLSVPFLGAIALIALGLLRRLRPGGWRRDHGLTSLVSIAALAVLVHSAVDFDWTYPSLMAVAAVLAAVGLASSTPALQPRPPSRPAAFAVLVLVLATAVLAGAAHGGGWRLSAPHHTSTSASPLRASGEPAS